MNTVLSTRVDEQHHRQHRHPQHTSTSAKSARRVGIADRVALHVGIALITWSRRPLAAPRPAREYNAHEYRERRAARAAREEQWQRAAYISQPWH